jgi:hypothetical protein
MFSGGAVPAAVVQTGKGFAMRLVITINCDNAAFEEGMEGLEVARILREVARKVEYADLDVSLDFSVLDSNGNKVGRVVCE